jgi:hypothetical protein
MKTQTICAVLALLLGACSERTMEPQHKAAETALADSHQIQDTLKRCKENRAAVGEAECRAASEAFRKRFMGSGGPNYQPQSVDMFANTPDKITPKPVTRSESQPAKE